MVSCLSPAKLEARMQEPALIDGRSGHVFSYRDLSRLVATRLESVSHLSGGLCLLGARNTAEFVVDFLALFEVGCSTLLVPHDLEKQRLSDLVATYSPDAIYGFVGVDDYSVGRTSTGPAVEAVLLPTSGSTGSPKFVRLSKSNIEANASQIAKGLGISQNTRTLGFLKFSYSYGLSVLTSSLASGASVVLTESSVLTPDFIRSINDFRVTTVPGVPFSYDLYSRVDLLNKCPSIREMTQAGGRLEKSRILEFHQKMEDRGGSFFVMYGQTEATARISILPHKELPYRVGSVGRALINSQVWVSNPDSQGKGELILNGPQVMLGYAHSRADVTGVDNCLGTLNTGDIGRVDDQGWISIEGRLKRIGKVFGHRVSLDDIERRLACFGTVAVVDDGDRLAVFIDKAPSSLRELSREMERMVSLPPGAIRIYLSSPFPTLPSGKLDYQSLRDLL